MNKAQKILFWGGNIWYLGEGMLGPLFAVFTERVGGDVLEITSAWAAYLIAGGLLYIFIGGYVDKHHRKGEIMVLGYALNAAFTFSYLLVQTPFHLLLVQVGIGFAAALATPTWDALYAEYEDKKHSGFQWGAAGGAASIITGIGLIIGGIIVNSFSFSVLFIVMGCIQTVATIYQARILQITRKKGI